MKATPSFYTSGTDYKVTRRHIPEERNTQGIYHSQKLNNNNTINHNSTSKNNETNKSYDLENYVII
jgi:hypothetical protein